MPAAGTRKVEIDGKQQYLPEEEAEITRLIREGLAARNQRDHYKAQLEAIEAELTEIATRHRGAKGTVHLLSADGRKATVAFSNDTEVDAARVEALRPKLGALWSAFFQTRTVYSMARGYQKEMRSARLSDALKAAVGAAFAIIPRKPRVTLIDVGKADA